MNLWKARLASLLLAVVLVPTCARADDPQPLKPGDMLLGERTNNVRLALFGDSHTWHGASAAELKVGPESTEQLVLEGTGGWVTVYLKSWFHTRSTSSSTFQVQEHTSDFDGNLKPGQRWKARLVAQGSPVEWCNSLTQALNSEFEVGQPTDFTLKMDGNDTRIAVLPVIERGQWNRCYTGKRYTRLLYAPALKTVVSIEHIGFRPTGQVHESSFRFDVKELRRATP